MFSLNKNQRKQLDGAMAESFPQYHDLRILLSDVEWPGEMDYKLENIVAEVEGQDHVRFKLIEWTEKYGLTECLVKGAADARAHLQVWKDLVAEWYPAEKPGGLKVAGSRFPFVLNWLGLERIRRRVCLLERVPAAPDLPAQEIATAVLVGPDIVATTFLAVGEFFAKGKPVTQSLPLQARFDYLGVANTPSRRSGTPTALAGHALFAANEDLDIALLRLGERRGEDQMNGPLLERRKWMLLHGEVADGDPIVVLQHPRGRPVSLSFGVVRQSKWDPQRICYSAGVQPCSIGAPCFNAELRLVAIHQCPHQEGNRGIRVDAIRGFLNAEDLELED
jgi:hypothetical protein